MKTTRPTSPLTPQQCGSHEQRTFAIAQQTTAQYASFLSSERFVDQLKWKLLKSHEKVTIYRARKKSNTHNASVSSIQAPSSWQPQAKLLCVGTIRGTLDDAMYGAITPTELAMATRSLYIGDELVSHRVLQDIELPTPAEPFRYLGLKWAARSPSLAALIRPRDMVYVEASGINIMLTPDGHERVGYVIYDSVDSSDLKPETSDTMVRARVTACYLFRQTGPSVVELYGTMFSNTGGNIPSKLAALSGAAVMISVSKVVDCALKKKLASMRAARSAERERLDDGSQENHERRCRVCSRGLSLMSSVVKCQICYTNACSRCITTRTLAGGVLDSKLAKVATPMCKSCVSSASRADNAVELARWEYQRGNEAASREVHSPRRSCNSVPRVDSSPSFSSSTSSNRVTHTSFDANTSPLTLLYSEPAEARGSMAMSDLADADDDVTGEISTGTTPAAASDSGDLWNQMNALRLQAEQTFLVVSQQSQSLRRSELD